MNSGEQLVIAMENALESAKGVYRETEKLVDAVGNPNDLADRINNEAYGDLLKAGQLIEYARHICQLGAFPSYPQPHGYTADLVEKGREQDERIGRHLSFSDYEMTIRERTAEISCKHSSMESVECRGSGSASMTNIPPLPSIPNSGGPS